MASEHYTQFGMTCLNDTSVYDTDIPATMASTISFTPTTTLSSMTAATSLAYSFSQTMTTSTVSHSTPATSPTATDGSDREAIGLQKQSNKIALGVGVGFGLPAFIAAVAGIMITYRRLHHGYSGHASAVQPGAPPTPRNRTTSSSSMQQNVPQAQHPRPSSNSQQASQQAQPPLITPRPSQPAHRPSPAQQQASPRGQGP